MDNSFKTEKNTAKRHSLFCQIKYDFLNGIYCNRFKYVFFIILVILWCLIFYSDYSKYAYLNMIHDTFTYSDCVLYMFRGQQLFDIRLENIFDIPFCWISMQIYSAFVIGNYSTKDLSGFNQQLLIRSYKKSHWFWSKCIYCVTSISILYLLSYLVIAVYSIIMTNEFSFAFNSQIALEVSKIDINNVNNVYKFIHIYFLPFLTTITIALYQFVLSLLIKPILSFTLAIVYNILSAYFSSYLFIGNYSMILRSNLVLGNEGINCWIALAIESILFVIAIAFGNHVLKKYDYLERS